MISFHQAKSYRFLINDSPTAKEIDYDKYLNPAGLNLIGTSENGKAEFKLARIDNMDASQREVLESMLR